MCSNGLGVNSPSRHVLAWSDRPRRSTGGLPNNCDLVGERTLDLLFRELVHLADDPDQKAQRLYLGRELDERELNRLVFGKWSAKSCVRAQI
jgi:hypothetical protein